MSLACGTSSKAAFVRRPTVCALPDSLSTHRMGRICGRIVSMAGFEDIFDLQDQVTASVVGAIAPKLEQAEIARARRKRSDSLDAYDLYLRVLPYVHANSLDEIKLALPLLEQGARDRPQLCDCARLRGLVPRADVHARRPRRRRSRLCATSCTSGAREGARRQFSLGDRRLYCSDA